MPIARVARIVIEVNIISLLQCRLAENYRTKVEYAISVGGMHSVMDSKIHGNYHSI